MRHMETVVGPETFPTRAIADLLHRQRVASITEVRQALGGASPRTACRKLAAAGCRSSYSHSGRYYTLDSLAEYDGHGLWSYRDIRFSLAGTLLATAQALVERAPGGWFADELKAILGVETRNALGKLVARGRLAREPVDGLFLYCSTEAAQRRRQLRARAAMQDEQRGRQVADAAVRRATGILFSLFDEQQRRLYAGLESLRHGHGGDRHVGGRLGLDPATVAKGRKQLLAGDITIERVRRPGGGRKAVERKSNSTT